MLTGKAVITTEYCVSAWSPGIWAVIAACLGTIMVPFVHETSYWKLQPLEDGGDQETTALGGTSLVRVGDAGAPGQALAHNTTQKRVDIAQIAHSKVFTCNFTEATLQRAGEYPVHLIKVVYVSW